MRVVLFAPYLSVESGGIWNFYQWVARYLGASFQYLHVGPAMLLEEIRKAGGEDATQVSLESLRSSTESTFIYRLLEDRAGAGTVAFKISCYGRLMNSLKSLYTRKATERAAAKLLRRESVDVVHIPAQLVPMPKVVRNYPYIINPHDYQHEHFPEFFPKRILRLRRKLWYRDQRNANAVVVHSRQTRLDALRFLGIPEERLFYAPYGPLDNFPEPDDGTLQRTIDDFKLPRRFVFYPARSWPHKNHAVLVEALARLKKRGIEVNAVFTTVEGEYGEAVKEKIRAAGLEREAIHFGKSIVASQLEEVVSTLDGAGSLVDPHSVQEIADAIDQLWSSEDTLEKAGAAIRKRRSLMSWKPFQDAYRSAYTYAIEHFH
jgi:glycosyltransferase involved in cell wall biosynthesis